MFTTNKIKWLGTLTLAVVLLVLALIGGNWGTTFAADLSALQAPRIDSIEPKGIKVGSPKIWILIRGANFGDSVDTRVRLSGMNYDEMIEPFTIFPDYIYIEAETKFFSQPETYIITVVRSTSHTIPTIPTIDPIDLVSNKVDFTVFIPNYLPVISK